jgi:hypothetical protein
MYRTEFGPVDRSFGGIASDPDLMRYEAYWRIRGEARG